MRTKSINKLLGIVVLSLLLSGKAFAEELFFQCVHSDKSKSMFVYSYDKKNFYVYFSDNYKLVYEMDIVNLKNDIIYAERYVPNFALDKMIRHSSVEFNILTYDMTTKTYGYDVEEKKHLRFELKCNKFFKMD